MSWLILIASGSLEAVWASALAASGGLRKWRPTLIFAVAMTASMLGLAWAMKTIPTATAYAVWAGIGASLTVIVAIATKQERATPARVAALLVLVGAVVGLKAVS